MKRVIVLYNLAERLEKGVPSDLICEQEITIIVPLVIELLEKRGYHVETLKADLNLWEELKGLKRRANGLPMGTSPRLSTAISARIITDWKEILILSLRESFVWSDVNL